MGRFVSATGQFLLATYEQFSRPPMGSSRCPLTTGRGSRAPTFLRNLGYEAPVEDEVTVQVAYSSQLFQLPADALQLVLLSVDNVPGRPTGMALCRYESNTWMLTAVGLAGVETPSDCGGLLDFAAQLAPGPISVLRTGQPVGDLARYRVPSSRWRRYDRLRRTPTGFLVTGDAMCSFNPVYGQGMTVAAMDAVALRECLLDGKHDLAQRFFATASRGVGVAWRMAAGADQAMPEIDGNPTMPVRLTNAYLASVLSAAESNPAVAEQFWKVINMTASPTELFRPRVLRSLASTHLHRVAGIGRRHAA